MSLVQILLSLISGGLVGLSLGLIGGGGVLLPRGHGRHVRERLFARSLRAEALVLSAPKLGHARDRNVKWPCAVVFAGFGIAGAALGAHLGKAVDGAKLLAGFGVLMIAIALLMLRPRRGGDRPDVHLDQTSARQLFPALAGTGFGVGALSGFFGIGGGFLIVPGLVMATSMPLLNAIGSSLVSVAGFGATTAASYALSGLVDWGVAVTFIVGGIGGGFIGLKLAQRLAHNRRILSLIFSGVVAIVGVYVVARGLMTLL